MTWIRSRQAGLLGIVAIFVFVALAGGRLPKPGRWILGLPRGDPDAPPHLRRARHAHVHLQAARPRRCRHDLRRVRDPMSVLKATDGDAASMQGTLAVTA